MRHDHRKTLDFTPRISGMHLVRVVRRMSRNLRRCHRGFSLVEIMVVVALIGVLAGVAIPAISGGLKQYEVLSAGQQVASTIRTARWQAVAKNKNLQIRFDYPAGGEYQVVDAADGTTAIGDIQTLPTSMTFNDPMDLTFDTE